MAGRIAIAIFAAVLNARSNASRPVDTTAFSQYLWMAAVAGLAAAALPTLSLPTGPAAQGAPAGTFDVVVPFAILGMVVALAGAFLDGRASTLRGERTTPFAAPHRANNRQARTKRFSHSRTASFWATRVMGLPNSSEPLCGVTGMRSISVVQPCMRSKL